MSVHHLTAKPHAATVQHVLCHLLSRCLFEAFHMGAPCSTARALQQSPGAILRTKVIFAAMYTGALQTIPRLTSFCLRAAVLGLLHSAVASGSLSVPPLFAVQEAGTAYFRAVDIILVYNFLKSQSGPFRKLVSSTGNRKCTALSGRRARSNTIVLAYA